MNKQRLLDAAEVFDSWRVVPRILVFAYGWLVGWASWFVLTNYFRLPASERTAAVTTFVGIVLPGIFGLAVWIFKIYSDNGRDWDADKQPAPGP